MVDQQQSNRAEEFEDLLAAVKDVVKSSIKTADDASLKVEDHRIPYEGKSPRTTLIEQHPPKTLQQLLGFSLPESAKGRDGVVEAVKALVAYSVNTWDQGFLDKLYASTTPVGLVADLVLSSLNTNCHIYPVAPALTVIEKQTASALASRFGLHGPFAGGVSQPGGSAANQSSIVIARNNLHPETKERGIDGKKFVLFTSAHGHYSLEKASQMLGFGSNAIRSVPVDAHGHMQVDHLQAMVQEARRQGETAFYVNATAGTTVLGSFDPLDAIADVCEAHRLWLHVDASWGGPLIFSQKQRHKLKGIERANSVTICPHKMMGVPLTCSFLIGADLRQFHRAMTLPASYLFHGSSMEKNDGRVDHCAPSSETATAHHDPEQGNEHFWDLADLTPQCGRRADSLKLALSWVYYGSAGFEAYVDRAFDTAAHLTQLVQAHPRFALVSEDPPPCLQVCFYFDKHSAVDQRDFNSRMTEGVVKKLIPMGFMVDYAPGANGKFFRVVVNGRTRKETVEDLLKAIEDAGNNVKPWAVSG